MDTKPLIGIEIGHYVILRDSFAFGINKPELVLGRRVALLSGLAILFHGLNVIYSHAVAMAIHIHIP